MNKLIECLIDKNYSYIPVWFMRQAGRYLPEFREIRKNNKDFIKLCLKPKLVSEITLQPIKRFNLDAAIIFSDILIVPYGLGQKVTFKKGFGPLLGNLDWDKINQTKNKTFIERVQPVYESIQKVKKRLNKECLIGFVGAPWTILVYMLNKQSPKKNFNIQNIKKNKTLLKDILRKIEEIIYLHAFKQAEAGAEVIQIFDSWAGLLPEEELDEYCLNPTKRIVDKLKKSNIPVICFPRGIRKNYLKFCNIVKPDCVNIDYEIDPVWARKNINNVVIQGGMDPKILLKKETEIKKNVDKFLRIFNNYPYIFNLGHGVLPETKPESIEYLVKLIKEKNV